MIKFFKKSFVFILIVTFVVPSFVLYAETPKQKSELFITPRFANFLVGSTFEAGIYLDTKGQNINAVNLKASFDPKKLAIVKPSGGKSVFGIWIDPPAYDNTKGTLSFSGIIPEGIVTSSGLVGTVTFKVLTSGQTTLKILPSSTVLLNDGLGTETDLFVNTATYTLNELPPDGVVISSITHPSIDHWYNNNNPVVQWESPIGSSGFSVELDSNPHTIPKTNITTTTPMSSFKDIADGVWYVHVRSNIKNVWENSSHFGLKIDTTAPVSFTPEANILDETSINNERKYAVLFSTTDALSGIDHYEVGVVSKDTKEGSLPIFIQTESPYVVSVEKNEPIQVIVRAFDTAGNLREAHINLRSGFLNIIYIILGGLILLVVLLHYLLGHKLWKHFKRAYEFFKKDTRVESVSDTVPLPNYENNNEEDNK